MAPASPSTHTTHFYKSSSGLAVPGIAFGSPSAKQPSNNQDAIKVLCRFRPASKLEVEKCGSRATLPIYDKDFSAVQIQSSLAAGQDSSSDRPGTPHQTSNIFRFDRLFSENDDQEKVFTHTASSIVDDVMKGYNGTILAYGQTGAGKTWTMMGQVLDPKDKGLTPRIVEKIFDTIVTSSSDLEFTVKVSFMEIYMERVKDLLNPINDNLPVHEDKTKGVYVKGLLEVFVGSVQEVLEVMTKGQEIRSVGSTTMNVESSRSHSIFQLCITQKNTITGSTRTGKLSLVDLAGSEKTGKTGATGQTLEEAKKINKSLSCLGNVINSLTDGKSLHIPYRDSKLTRILQESLGGNARTSLIINCSPSPYNELETLSTLRFGVRAKSIKNKAKINTELSPAELKVLLKQARTLISRLEGQVSEMGSELSMWRSGGHVPDSEWSPSWTSAGLIGAAAVAAEQDDPFASAPQSATVPSLFTEQLPHLPLPGDDQDEIINLKDQLSDRDLRIIELEQEVSSLKSRETVMLQSQEKIALDSKKLSLDLAELQLAIEKARYEASEGKLSLDSLRDEKVLLESRLHSQGLELATLRTRVVDLEQERQEEQLVKQRQASMPSNTLQAATTELTSLKSQLDVSQTQLENANSTILHLSTALENSREERECMASRLHTVQENLKQVQAEYQELLEHTFPPSHDDEHDDESVEDRLRKLEDEERKVVEKGWMDQLEQVRGEALYLQSVVQHKEAEIKDLQGLVSSLQAQQATIPINNASSMKQNQNQNGGTSDDSKISFLQSALDQVSHLQTQLLLQNGQLKREVEAQAKKLVSRSERISRVEGQLTTVLAEKSEIEARYLLEKESLESKVRDLQGEVDSSKASLHLPSASWINSSKIAKPLRGGGSGATHSGDSTPFKNTSTHPSTPISGTGESANTIGNLSSPKSLQGKRSSWYVSLLKK